MSGRRAYTEARLVPALSPAPWKLAAACATIVLGVVAAYYNSRSGPFVFDDIPSIVTNPTIRTLWPPAGPLSPPSAGGVTVGGRPFLNLTLALNFAASGTAVGGYHALNLVLHALAGVVLFGVARRTLLQPILRERHAADSLGLATALGLLWTLHPLQTESVTYVVQRAESLCGLLYLLTVYAFIRGSETRPMVWLPLSVATCFLGMATKEVMVSAPLIALLYDRTFIAGSVREAWRRRASYYVGLASSWLLLGWLVLGVHGRGGSAGFGTQMSWWAYALTQCRAIVLYVKLVLWPHPLVFDYGTTLVLRPLDVAPQAFLLLVLVLSTLIGLRRRPALGFLGVWFLATLAPSSSVVPVVTQTIAEHRMYLPLAAVLALVVLAIYRWLGRAGVFVCAAAALACGVLTSARNEQYCSAVALWGDTVAKRPDNARARNALGLALAGAGRRSDAVEQLEQAARLEPQAPEIRNNLANRLAQVGRLAEALEQIDTGLQLAPDLAEAHDSKGDILALQGRWPEARDSYATALQLKPELAEAREHLLEALRHAPDAAGTHTTAPAVEGVDPPTAPRE
jgi:protein O-mannosyl-transferase